MTHQASTVRLDTIRFPDEARVKKQEVYGQSFAFYNTLVDVETREQGDITRYRMRVSNRGLSRHPLTIRFATDRSLAYVPTWLHNPPVYELQGAALNFAHYGLPKRSAAAEGAIPADLPLAVCMDPGTNAPCEMIACETTDKGVGMRLGDGGVTFSFLDGTERSAWELVFYVVRGAGLIDCVRNYHAAVPYQGVRGDGPGLMWFYDDAWYADAQGRFDLDRLRADARTVRDLGAKYVVIEPGHLSQHFDARYWGPRMAERHPRMAFFVQSLEVLTELGLAPLMYYNCVHGRVKLMTDPDFGMPDLHRLRYKAADAGLEQVRMQEAMAIDMNWFKGGVVPSTEYPMDSDPVIDVRAAEWRDWLCRRITFLLKTYPQLAGTYIDTWPAGLPIFGEGLNAYDAAYDGNSWWNGMNDFMWDVRQVTRSFADKVLMLNDSRMPKKVMEAADLILNEDAGAIANPERAFWHCLRSALVGHSAKPCYQFHHGQPSMRNDVRARTVMACGGALGLGYCVIYFTHKYKEEDTGDAAAYTRAVRDMAWATQEAPREVPEVAISGQTRNIESLAYATDRHEVKLDFPSHTLDVRETAR